MSWMIGKVHLKVLFARSKGEGETTIDVLCTHCIHVGKLVAGRLPRRSAGWPIPFMRACKDIFNMDGLGKGGVLILISYVLMGCYLIFLVKGNSYKSSLYRGDEFVPHTKFQ